MYSTLTLLFTTFVFVLASASFASAQSISVSSPLVQCQAALLSWSETRGPYFVSVLPNGGPRAFVLETLHPTNDTSLAWLVGFSGGTVVEFELLDSTGGRYVSPKMQVLNGPDASCLHPSLTGGTVEPSRHEAAVVVQRGLEGLEPNATPSADPEVMNMPSGTVVISMATDFEASSMLLQTATLPVPDSTATPSTSVSIDPDAPPSSVERAGASPSIVFSGPVYSAGPGGFVPLSASPTPGLTWSDSGALNSGSVDRLSVHVGIPTLAAGLVFLSALHTLFA